MKRSIALTCATALSVAASALSARAGVKEDDVNIGVNPATNQLGVIWLGNLVELPEISGPLFGFGADEPGLITIGVPAEGLEPLGVGASLVLEVISFDAALKGWRPGFAGNFHDPGDTMVLGKVPVHQHPFWHIDSVDPGFVAPPAQSEWNATFRILDVGSTGYLSSDPVTVTFTPEPGSLALYAFGGVLGVYRARHRLRRSVTRRLDP